MSVRISTPPSAIRSLEAPIPWPVQPPVDSRASSTDGEPAFPRVALESVERPSSAPSLDATVEEMRSSLLSTDTNLEFKVDKETGRTVVKVVDSATGEVLRQVPTEEILTLAAAVKRMSGVVFDLVA